MRFFVFDLAAKLKKCVYEMHSMPISELVEWVAYFRAKDPKDREDYELQIAREQDDTSKTQGLINFFKKFTKKGAVKNGSIRDGNNS